MSAEATDLSRRAPRITAEDGLVIPARYVASLGGRYRFELLDKPATFRAQLLRQRDLVSACDLICGEEKTPREVAGGDREAARLEAVLKVALDILAGAAVGGRGPALDRRGRGGLGGSGDGPQAGRDDHPRIFAGEPRASAGGAEGAGSREAVWRSERALEAGAGAMPERVAGRSVAIVAGCRGGAAEHSAAHAAPSALPRCRNAGGTKSISVASRIETSHATVPT